MKNHSFQFLCFLATITPTMAVEALNTYIEAGNYPIAVSEASGITYNWDTDTLFAIGDEGEALVQFDKTGKFINSMAFDFDVSPRELRGLDDPEGVAYLGDNTFMIADERDMFGRVTIFQPGERRTQADLAPTSYDFDPNNLYDEGNSGLEGVAYDPVDKVIYGIKELQPLTIFRMAGVPQISTSQASSISVTSPIASRNITRWGTNYDFTQGSDIYALASSAAFPPGHSRRLNLLLLSRNANRILEVDRAGNVIDSLDIRMLGQTTVEGITMDNQGILYLVSEGVGLHVLAPPAQEFRITGYHFIHESGKVSAEMTWKSVAGSNYMIQYSPDLRGEWQNASALITATEDSTTGSTEAMMDTGRGFFRITRTNP